MGRRTLLLIAAFLVAALGTTMVFLYVNGLENRYAADQQAQRILVAADDIQANTRGSDAMSNGLFTFENIPQSAVVPGALSSADEIADRFAVAPIAKGEQILASKFGAQGSEALPIPPGKLAVAVQVDDPLRVAGFVQPGSNVAVFVSTNKSTAVLLPKVRVIAVGKATTPAAAQQSTDQSSGAITLALDQQETEKIVHAKSSGGELYFGLLGDQSPALQPGEPVSSRNLFKQ